MGASRASNLKRHLKRKQVDVYNEVEKSDKKTELPKSVGQTTAHEGYLCGPAGSHTYIR